MLQLQDLVPRDHIESLPGGRHPFQLQSLPLELLRFALCAALPSLPPLLANFPTYLQQALNHQRALTNLRLVNSAFRDALGPPTRYAATSLAAAARLAAWLATAPDQGVRIRSLVLRGDNLHARLVAILHDLTGWPNLVDLTFSESGRGRVEEQDDDTEDKKPCQVRALLACATGCRAMRSFALATVPYSRANVARVEKGYTALFFTALSQWSHLRRLCLDGLELDLRRGQSLPPASFRLQSLSLNLTMETVVFLVEYLAQHSALCELEAVEIQVRAGPGQRQQCVDHLEGISDTLAQGAPRLCDVAILGGSRSVTVFSVAKFPALLHLTVHNLNFSPALLHLPRLREITIILMSTYFQRLFDEDESDACPPFNWKSHAQAVLALSGTRSEPLDIRLVSNMAFGTDLAGASFAFGMIMPPGSAPQISVSLVDKSSGYRASLWPPTLGSRASLCPQEIMPTFSADDNDLVFQGRVGSGRGHAEEHLRLALERCSW